MKNKIMSILLIFILLFFIPSSNALAKIITSETGVELSVSDNIYNALVQLPEYSDDNYGLWYNNGTAFFIDYTQTSSDFKIYINKYIASVGNGIATVKEYIFSGSSFTYNGIKKADFLNWPLNKTNSHLHNIVLYGDSSYETIFFDDSPKVVHPTIVNTDEDLATGTYEYILVNPGSFDNNENIDLYIYDITNIDEVTDDIYSKPPLFGTVLNKSSAFYKSVTVEDVTEFWYEIPRSNLGINFSNGKRYLYSVLLGGAPVEETFITVGGLTEGDVLNNSINNLEASIIKSNEKLEETIKQSNKELQGSIDKQTEAIEENNKTNKNIFEKIGDILSYINPFSENFFGKKLVELIINGIKSLFIPGDDFFSNFFNDLNDWFSDRFGFLYYPLELLFDVLNRFLNINFSNPIINIPNIEEPFTGEIFIKATQFNFNDLLTNNTLKNVHDIYLIIVDAVIYVGLVLLLYNKYEEVIAR